MLRQIIIAPIFALAAAGTAAANPLYLQGFETDTSGWVGNNGIAQTASGGGSLGLTPFAGSYYGETRNIPDDYQTGYGDGGYSFLNGDGVTAPAFPGAFSQSISVYIDTSLTQPYSYGEAFWIDMSPSLNGPDGVGCDPAACSDEHNFRLSYNGSSVGVTVDGSGTPALIISLSGWYTFQNTYELGALPTDLVQTHMNIFDASDTLLSSTLVQGDSDGGMLYSYNLAGPGYIWLPVWQNGFSNDVLGIDNVRADTLVPEAPVLPITLSALIALALLSLRRRRPTS